MGIISLHLDDSDDFVSLFSFVSIPIFKMIIFDRDVLIKLLISTPWLVTSSLSAPDERIILFAITWIFINLQLSQIVIYYQGWDWSCLIHWLACLLHFLFSYSAIHFGTYFYQYNYQCGYWIRVTAIFCAAICEGFFFSCILYSFRRSVIRV